MDDKPLFEPIIGEDSLAQMVFKMNAAIKGLCAVSDSLVKLATSEAMQQYVNDQINEVKSYLDDITLLHKLVPSITHNLNAYPSVFIIEFDYGCGMGGYDTGPCGGSNGKLIRNTVEYLDRNRIQVSVEKQYGTVESIMRIKEKEYIVSFVDSTLSLYLTLMTNSQSDAAPTQAYTDGVHVGSSPPEDIGLLWLRPVSSNLSSIINKSI